MSRTEALVRAAVARHNRRVAAVCTVTLSAAIVAWCFAYEIFTWLSLLLASVAQGLDAKMPRHLPVIAIYIGGALFLIALALRAFPRDERAVDRRSWMAVLSDVVLALPRLTIAAWTNLTAWQRLSKGEFEHATHLIDHLREQPVLPVAQLLVIIPDKPVCRRIVLALQLAQLVELKRRQGVTALALCTPTRRRLMRASSVSIRGRAENRLARADGPHHGRSAPRRRVPPP